MFRNLPPFLLQLHQLKVNVKIYSLIYVAIQDSVKLNVSYKGASATITVMVNITVQEATTFIASNHPDAVKATSGTEYINLINKYKDSVEYEYGLFVPFPQGIWLKNDVKLSKYNLKDNVWAKALHKIINSRPK